MPNPLRGILRSLFNKGGLLPHPSALPEWPFHCSGETARDRKSRMPCGKIPW
jgi:hypothetical protein